MKKKYITPVRYDVYNNKLNEGEYYSPARKDYLYKFTDATGNIKNITSPTLHGLRMKEERIVDGIYTAKVTTKCKSEISSKKVVPPKVLTESQQASFLNYIFEMKRFYYPLVLLQLSTGLESKELLALTLNDILLEQNLVKITHQFRTESCSEIIKVDEKHISFNDEVKEVLRDKILIAQYIYDTAGIYELDNYDQFLFITTQGKPIKGSVYNEAVSRASNAYNKQIDSIRGQEEGKAHHLPRLSSRWLIDTAKMRQKNE